MGQLHQRLIHGGQQFAFIQRQRPTVALRRQMRAQGGDVFERAVQRQAVGIDQLTDLGKKSTLIMAFYLKIAGFAAAFCQQTHRANHHIFLHRFTHVVNGQRRHGGRRQRLHLHAGFPG